MTAQARSPSIPMKKCRHVCSAPPPQRTQPLCESASSCNFLRNSHRLGGLGGSSLEDIPECFCPPLEVGKNSLAVALLVIGGARIGIFHAVAQRVVKEYGDLAGCGRNGFRLADTGRQAAEECS